MSEVPSSLSPEKRGIEDVEQSNFKRIKSSDDSTQDDLSLPQITSRLGNDMPMQLPGSTPVTSTSFQIELPDIPDINIDNLLQPQTNTNNNITAFTPTTATATATTTATATNNNNNTTTTTNNNNNSINDNDEHKKPVDPEKLSDTLLSAGVDLKAEEALLKASMNNISRIPPPPVTMGTQLQTQPQMYQQPIILNTPFLDPRHLANFMSKVGNANGIRQIFENEPGILDLVTNACQEWLTNIITNAVVISRHRRRSLKQRKRSEISKALRELAVEQKTLEDRRLQKRKTLGIDNDDEEKQGSDETQHKATNATVAMMTGAKSKKYSWMTGASGSSSGSKISAGAGEGGIRFREAREEPGLVVRDLLSSLEKKRMSVQKTITKGYANLKD